MYHSQAADKYKYAQYNVSKTQLVVMLYDGMIRFVKQAMDAATRNDIQTRYDLIMKAVAIIDGLQAALDFDQGGDIARILYGYYSSLYARIMSVHGTNSIDTLKEVLDDIVEMRSAWQKVDEVAVQGGQVAGVPAAAINSDQYNTEKLAEIRV